MKKRGPGATGRRCWHRGASYAAYNSPDYGSRGQGNAPRCYGDTSEHWAVDKLCAVVITGYALVSQPPAIWGYMYRAQGGGVGPRPPPPAFAERSPSTERVHEARLRRPQARGKCHKCVKSERHGRPEHTR
jgi:hypothetical protein